MKVKKFLLAQKSCNSPSLPLVWLSVRCQTQDTQCCEVTRIHKLLPNRTTLLSHILLKELIFKHQEHAYFRKVILCDQHSYYNSNESSEGPPRQ